MIYLIIGASCSGKTQIVTNTFLKNSKEIICYKDILKITKTDTAYLIGDYTVDKKVRGTDRISRSQLKLIAPQIIKLFTTTDYIIVAEGVNICWSFVLDALLPYKSSIQLIYLECSKETSLYRNHVINEHANDTWFKSIWTRSNNIFIKYCNLFDSYIINTNSDSINFAEITLNNIKLIKSNRTKQRLF